MERLMVGLLMLFAFAVPWEYALDLGEPLGNVARILGLVLLAVMVLRALARRKIRRLGALQWLVLALFLYFACSYFWTVEGATTFSKIRAYFQVMSSVWVVWEVADQPQYLRGMMRAFVAGCWVLAVLTLLDYSSASAIAAQQARFSAEGQDPNDVARFLDLGFPLAALLFASETQWASRLLAIGYFPMALGAVLLTASRGGFSAALAAMFGCAVLLVVWRPRAASMVFVGLAVTAGALWLFVPAGSLDRLATIPQEVQGGTLNERLDIWHAGWHAFTQAPWWGYGAGTFTTAARLAAGDTAHNTLMAVLVTGGLAGMTIFLAILISVTRAIWQTEGLLRIALGTLFLVWAITSLVGSVEENRATWLLFGLIAAAARLEVERHRCMRDVFAGEGLVLRRIPIYAGR